MENFTQSVTETTTDLGQNISEETATELLKSAKSMNDNVFAHIHMYGLIILIPLGIIFNSLSLIVFRISKDFSTSIGNHLKCISISDSIMLVGMLLTSTNEYWEEKLGLPDIFSMNNFSCKMSMYVAKVGCISTGLIMTSATIERFLAIALPLKYRSWNTLRTSKIILSVFFILSIGISTFVLFFREITEKGKCGVIEKHRKIYDLMYTIFPTAIANGICGSVILIFTLMIIGLLFHQSRVRNALTNNSVGSNSKKEIRVSVMLVSIASLFILLRFPKVIIMKLILANSGNPLLIQSVSKLVTFLIAVNHSVNFVIYMIFMESFRKTFCDMFSCFNVKIIECIYKFRGEKPDDD